jgi:hypothetical protein
MYIVYASKCLNRLVPSLMQWGRRSESRCSFLLGKCKRISCSHAGYMGIISLCFRKYAHLLLIQYPVHFCSRIVLHNPERKASKKERNAYHVRIGICESHSFCDAMREDPNPDAVSCLENASTLVACMLRYCGPL